MSHEYAYGLRIGAIIGSAGFVVMALLAYHYAIYPRIRGNAKVQKGRGFSSGTQGNLFGWAFIILLAYIIMPSTATPLDPEGHGFIVFFWGAVLLASSIGHWFTPQRILLYQRLIAISLLVASLGLLSHGIPWMLWRPYYPMLKWIGFTGSMTILCACELVFLFRNGWRFLPRDPR